TLSGFDSSSSYFGAKHDAPHLLRSKRGLRPPACVHLRAFPPPPALLHLPEAWSSDHTTLL
ncbi:MAG: hypothetical protein OK436_02650, partial [Thaumarchaeota archaeon]|nr:hypothetical protein [Nitrososphaerota archaeon]